MAHGNCGAAARHGPGFGGFFTINGTRHKVPDWMSHKEAKRNVMLRASAEGIKTIFVEPSETEQCHAANRRLFADIVGGMRLKTEINPLNCDLKLVSELWEEPCDVEDGSEVGPERSFRTFRPRRLRRPRN